MSEGRHCGTEEKKVLVLSRVITGHDGPKSHLLVVMNRHLVECESAQLLERIGSQQLSTDLSKLSS